VTVTQTETGMMRLTNCPDLVCLDTGQGQETEQDGWLAYTLSAQISFDEQDVAFSYFSQPFQDKDLGNRQFQFTGNSAINLILNGRAFQFSGLVSTYVAELWPAYVNRIYMTGGMGWKLDTPFGHFQFANSGERSISYVTTPLPHSGVPTMDLPFQPLQVGSYISGPSYFVTLRPDVINLRVEVDAPAPVPLPASGLLLAIGVGGLLATGARRRVKAKRPKLSLRACRSKRVA
jgi:hypothetical protein